VNLVVPRSRDSSWNWGSRRKRAYRSAGPKMPSLRPLPRKGSRRSVACSCRVCGQVASVANDNRKVKGRRRSRWWRGECMCRKRKRKRNES
jgi:hypothetical protein